MSQLGPFFSVTAQLCLSSSTSYNIPYQTCCLGLLLTPDLPFLFQAAREQAVFIKGIDDVRVNSGISSFPLFRVHKVQLTGSVSRLRGFSSLTENHLRIKLKVKRPFTALQSILPRICIRGQPGRRASGLVLYSPCGSALDYYSIKDISFVHFSQEEKRS